MIASAIPLRIVRVYHSTSSVGGGRYDCVVTLFVKGDVRAPDILHVGACE